MGGCAHCPYGSYDKLSDICDGCRNDPDTGWGGFTDHYLGRHFESERARDTYIERYGDEYRYDAHDLYEPWEESCY